MKLKQIMLPDDWTCYAELPNGSEIREASVTGRTYYFVQPATDNYWTAHRTPEAALRAFNLSRRAMRRAS